MRRPASPCISGAPPASGRRPTPKYTGDETSPLRTVATLTNVDEARTLFRQLHGDVHLEPRSGDPFAWTLRRAVFGGIVIQFGTFAGALELSANPLAERFILVTTQTGHIGGVFAKSPVEVAPGARGAMLSPERAGVLVTQEGTSTMNTSVEGAALTAHLVALTGSAARGPLCFDVPVALDVGAKAIHQLVQLLAAELAAAEPSHHLLTSLRDACLTSLLVNIPHNQTSLLTPDPPRVAPAHVRRAEAYIDAHLAEPIALADLAAAAGVPFRSLQAAFRTCRGASPMQFLKERRFELARQRLLAADPAETAIRQVATSVGLVHTGRFSVEYRQRFGEHPQATLRRLGGSMPRC